MTKIGWATCPVPALILHMGCVATMMASYPKEGDIGAGGSDAQRSVANTCIGAG